MLKTNSKIVRNRMIEHIKDSYEDIEDLKHDAQFDLVQNGCMLCYYNDIREYLKETLEETEEEAKKYSNEQVWNTYKVLCNRAIKEILDNA